MLLQNDVLLLHMNQQTARFDVILEERHKFLDELLSRTFVAFPDPPNVSNAESESFDVNVLQDWFQESAWPHKPEHEKNGKSERKESENQTEDPSPRLVEDSN